MYFQFNSEEESWEIDGNPHIVLHILCVNHLRAYVVVRAGSITEEKLRVIVEISSVPILVHRKSNMAAFRM